MFLVSTTYEKQLTNKKMGLSHQVWSHGASTLKKRKLNSQNFRPAQTDPNVNVSGRSIINFHPRNQDVHFDMLEMFQCTKYNENRWLNTKHFKKRDVIALKKQYVYSTLLDTQLLMFEKVKSDGGPFFKVVLEC